MAIDFAPSTTLARPASQNRTLLRHVLEQITADSCPHGYNFHMHTTYSDGQLSPTAIIDQAITIGLKGFAITDHHSVKGFRESQPYLEQYLDQGTQIPQESAPLPHLWVGVEINADLLGIEVHILGYAFDPDHSVLQPYLQGEAVTGPEYEAGQVIQAIQKAGGLAILAHPARYRRSVEDLIPAAAALGIDGVETYYAYNNPNPWQPSPLQTGQILELSQAYDLLNSCGTDTHGLNLRQRL